MARGQGSNATSPIRFQNNVFLQAGKPAVLRVPDQNADFRVVENEEGHRLIVPTKVKHKWDVKERWYRSAIVDREGYVLSMGFHKFFNAGENLEDTQSLNRALQNGERVFFTEKMDGSLAIRSVLPDGRILFRTRGTFDGGDEYGPAIRQVARARYPRLLDPTFMPNHSLHFEFVSPLFPIVVKYTDENLVFLGGVNHENLELLRYDQMQEVAQEADLETVPLHELPLSLEDLAQVIVDWQGREGIVARFADEQTYVKMKAAHYLAQHALRFQFGPRAAIEVCKTEDFADENAYIEHLHTLGLDWELAQARVPFYHVYDRARTEAKANLQDVEEFVRVYGDLGEQKHTRKKYAELVMQGYQDPLLRGTAFSLVDGRRDSAYALLLGKAIEKHLKAANLPEEDETDLG